MGNVLQSLEMLGPEGVQAEIKNMEFQYTHINKITSQANPTLGFFRKNLKVRPPKLWETAYSPWSDHPYNILQQFGTSLHKKTLIS